MAEIIRPQFGKKPGAEEPAQKTSVTESESLSDSDFVKQHRDLVVKAVQIETDFTDFIEKIGPGSINAQNVDIRREGLQQKSLQDLCTIWLTSRETDWKRNPSFYAAVVIERTLKTQALGERFD
jgi:hypothetical protein